MVQPKDWKVPLLEDDFSKDAFSSSKKAFNSLEDAYKRLSDEIPLLPNKGDLYVGIGSALTDVLSVGADGTYLTCDSTEAKGMKWASITIPAPGDAAFPAGTKLWFYQNTAPTYWTIDSTPADALLAVKGGTAAFNVSGGTQAGTWTHPNHTHTGPEHTHTGPSHTHTGPSHTHALQNSDMGHDSSDSSSGGITIREGRLVLAIAGDRTVYDPSTTTTAGGTGNTEAGGTGATGPGGTGATGNGATANTWRPLAQVGIICTKD